MAMELVFEEVHLVAAGVGVYEQVASARRGRERQPPVADDVLVEAAMAGQIGADRRRFERSPWWQARE